MKNLLILILISFLTGLSILAGEGDLRQNIRGTVVDSETTYPLPGATIILLNTEPIKGTTTDANGVFMLENIPVGRHDIEIRYVGYNNELLQNLYLNSGKELVLEIKLTENAFEVEEVVVKADANKAEALNDMASISARTFSVEETERYAGSLGDPARMVANYAGVMMQSDARNDIIIRGNSPIGVLWRLEGIEIPNPNHFGALGTTGGPVSMLNNNLLANSDFLTGAFPAEFGNALSGVFDLNMRSGNNQVTEYTGQVGFNGFEAGIEGPAFISGSGQKASYLINYRYSTLALVNNLGINTGTGTAVPEYQDASFIFDIPGTKAGRFKIIGLWGTSHINIQPDTINNLYGTPGTITDFGSDMSMVGLSHTIFINEKMNFKSTASYQTMGSVGKIDSLRYESGDVIPTIRSMQKENKFNFSTRFGYKIDARNKLEIGLMYDNIYVDYLDSIKSPNYQHTFRTTTDVGEAVALYRGFVQYQHKLNKKLTSYGGLYYQHFDLNKESVLEPRAGIKYQPTEKQAISFGFGMHSQIQPRLSYFHREFDTIAMAYSPATNRDLKFTRSTHYILGYDLMLNQDWRIKAETYYQDLYNVPVKDGFEEFSMLNAGAFFAIPREDSLENKGKGKNYGLELTLEKFLSNNYYFLFTASLFDSQFTGANGQWRNTAFNGNYVFNLLGGYEKRLSERSMLTVDIKLVWAGGNRYVPIDYAESYKTNQEVRIWEDAYEKRYPDYFRTDFRIGIKMNRVKYSQEFAMDFQNVTNHQSLFMEGVDLENQKPYEIYQQGFFPMALYRIQF